MRVKAALPVGSIRGFVRSSMRRSVTPVVLALVFGVSCGRLPAETQAQREAKARREAKKHEVKPHAAVKHPAAKHPDEHPDAHAKQREAAAKKRHGEDKKREAKTKRGEKKAHPVALKARPAHRDMTGMEGAPGRRQVSDKKSAADEVRASRVHAWEESKKKQAGAGQAAADSHADSLKNAGPASGTGAAGTGAAGTGAAGTNGESGGASTGVSNPPEDEEPQADVSKPAEVVSVIRRSGERPQLEPTEELAAEPRILPALYTKRRRLVVPPALKGSHEILLRQNQMADDEGLSRVQDDDDLARMRGAGLLVPVPASAKLRVDERLPANRRYCRPWAALFLADMAGQFYARFGEALQVNSAVRTVEVQQRLIRRNGNAAPAEGESASPHLTGQAVDIGKHGLSLAEIAWLRGYLLPLVQAGKVDVEEEFQQACFHISVYKSYLPRAGAGRREVAAVRHGGVGALAVGLR